MPGDDTILSVKGLRVSFEGTNPLVAVKGLSFTIGKGKTLAIVGESGSGKSLTALALMGLLPATAHVEGERWLRLGQENEPANGLSHLLEKETMQPIRGKHIGMVFQEPMSALNPIMKVGKQIEEAIRAHQEISTKDARAQAISWLEKVQLPEPAKLFSRYPHQLSGGQKQRVMIAMAMCNHPTLLIADEPTTALDATVQQEILHLMSFLQQEHGTAMIFITHDLAIAASIADDVLVMYQGEVMEYGPSEKVLSAPTHNYTKALLACRPAPAHKGRPLPVLADFLPAQERPPISLPIASSANAPAPANPAPILEVRQLGVWFPEKTSQWHKPGTLFKAVDDVSFTINTGEILGLVGESGSGKSTIGKALTGLVPVNSGNILFLGRDLTTLSPREWRRMRTEIQVIFQDPYSSLNPRMAIGDLLTEPMLVHNIVPKKELKNEALRLLALVQLPADSFTRYPHQFSGGQRQRIGIARALALRPKLLICDECVSALDVSVQAQILNLLKALQPELGLSYLFISHDLSVVQYISDRVMVMQAGKIVETGTAEQVLQSPVHSYTKKLIESIHNISL